MTRNYQFREEKLVERPALHPIWRGIGLIFLVALTVGAFWLAGEVLERQWQQPFLPFAVPRNFIFQPWPWFPAIPGKPLVQIGATIVIDLVGYALLVILFGIVNPVRHGPTDAPQPRGTGRHRSMTR
jgi:hypothetical protein